MFVSNQAFAQTEILNADVLLPDRSEYVGFKVVQKTKNLEYPRVKKSGPMYHFELFDQETGRKISASFYFFRENTTQEHVSRYIAHPNGPFIKGTQSKNIEFRNITSKLNFEGADEKIPKSYNVFAYEGKVIIQVGITMSRVTDKFGKVIDYFPLEAKEIYRVDSILEKMLHRMTALGLTSKPKDSAPEWAKKQVADRLAGRKS